MTISDNGNPPLVGPGGIAPDVVTTLEVLNETLLPEDIADIGKGTLFVGDGVGAINTIAPGALGTFLESDPGEALGVKWTSPAAGPFVLRAGDTMTGSLTLSGPPTVDLHAATKKYVDDEVGAIGRLATR
jgi:hypothetical protein